MREDLPSVTAAIVAYARAVASARPMGSPPLHDRAARSLLPGAAALLLPWGPLAPLSQGALRVATAGLIDQIALRTAAIDEALIEAIDVGVRQVVVLGAGLDARAYRLAELAEARVFEVDHPASQRYKTRRLGALTPRCRSLTHVPVDFVRDDLARSLAAAGHDEGAPSFWIWEGVTMYLPREATRATLDAVRRRSCPGSWLAMTYMKTETDLLPAPLRDALSTVLGVFGEPLRSSYQPEEAAELLSEEGFAVLSDRNSQDWAPRFGGSSALAFAFRSERLAVAARR